MVVVLKLTNFLSIISAFFHLKGASLVGALGEPLWLVLTPAIGIYLCSCKQWGSNNQEYSEKTCQLHSKVIVEKNCRMIGDGTFA